MLCNQMVMSCHWMKWPCVQTDINYTLFCFFLSTEPKFIKKKKKKNTCSHSRTLSMATFVKINDHFQGVFINKPFCYSDGVHHVFENIDFACMNVKEFFVFLERFTQETCEKVYYCMPDIEFPQSLRLISNEIKY